MVDHEKTQQVDQQIIKLQESPDMVPVGELPRHTLLTVDRCLTNKLFPGARVSVLGIYDVFQKSAVFHLFPFIQFFKSNIVT